MTRRLTVGFAGIVVAGALTLAASAGAGQDPTAKAPKLKAGRDTPTVMADIKAGKAKKVAGARPVTGVWTGCTFVYLHTDENVYRFDDDSDAHVSENPEPMPPRDPACVDQRNPTHEEMVVMEERVAAENVTQRPNVPPVGAVAGRATTQTAPPLTLPPDRYQGGPVAPIIQPKPAG
jgi:hypothetical protein